MEMLHLEAGVGPCVDCFRTGTAVSIHDIAAEGSAWPQFRDSALSQGFISLHAVPMRLQGHTIGALKLFRQTLGPLSPEDAAIAQGFADVATIGILQERASRESPMVNEQLQRALSSRIVIEQAKGVIAHTANHLSRSHRASWNAPSPSPSDGIKTAG